jgi:hypothetical protein
VGGRGDGDWAAGRLWGQQLPGKEAAWEPAGDSVGIACLEQKGNNKVAGSGHVLAENLYT